MGNHAYGHFLQAKLTVNRPGDRYEQEADRVADAVVEMPEGVSMREGGPDASRVVQRKCTACEEEDEHVQTKPATAHAPSHTPAAASRIEGLSGKGRRLSGAERSYFEPRFGADFSGVRVHTDAHAAGLAQSFQARAFATGHDVVFGADQYTPGTTAGQRLLAHELTHVMQQAAGHAGHPAVFRQPQETPRSPESEAPTLPPFTLPPFTLPGTGLTVIPGPLHPALLGQRLPLPANLRITNALGAGGGPSFVLDVAPERLVLNFLDRIDLATSTRPGTPPHATHEPENQQRISLLNPRITLEPLTGRLRGSATLSVGSEYPLALKGPTDIAVSIESTELGRFTGRLGYGPLHADFSLRLHYDTDRIERALAPAFSPRGGFAELWSQFQTILRATVPGIQLNDLSDALLSLLRAVMAGEVRSAEFVTRTLDLVRPGIPEGVGVEGLRTALSQLANEITHPGFSLRGRLGLGIPFLGTLPLTRFSAEAPTTVPLARPLLGAPTAFPLSFTAGGVIISPPGSLSETAVPALGFTHSNFGERSGFSATGALLPSLSLSAINAGGPLVEQFPVYAYVEVAHVRRLSDDLDLGLRLTVQVSTPELFGAGAQGATDPATQLNNTIQEFQEAQGRSEPLAVPNAGLTVFGRFGYF